MLASGRAFVILFAMTKTILICGYGKGISAGVASRFGAAGFAVGLVARNIDKLAAAVKTLSAAGVRAVPLPCDLSDPAAVTAMVAQARRDLGPVTVLHWNAYSSTAGDLTTAKIEAVRAALDVGHQCVGGVGRSGDGELVLNDDAHRFLVSPSQRRRPENYRRAVDSLATCS